MKQPTQIDLVLELLDMYEWVDPIMCWQQIGSMKLATLISAIIKDKGPIIEKQLVQYVNFKGQEKHYMKYRKKTCAET